MSSAREAYNDLQAMPSRIDVVVAAVLFLLLGMIPFLVQPWVERWWVVPDASNESSMLMADATREVSMLTFACACLGVAIAVAVVRRPFRLLPLRPLMTMGWYSALLPLWIVLAWTWLRLLHAGGAEFAIQGGLQYFVEDGRSAATAGFWAIALTVAIGAPIAEELIFRGYLQGGLTTLVGTWPAIALTAIAFGAIHPAGTRVPIGALGLLFGWLRHRSGGVGAPILAHMLHNSLTVLVVFCWPQTLGWLYPR